MKKRKPLSVIGYLLVVLVLLITLVHYSLVYGTNTFTIHDFLQNPHSYAGSSKNIMASYHNSFDGGFVVNYNNELITIFYDQEYIPPRYGEVLVYGILQRDGTVKAVGVHNYNYNYILYIVSFLAGIFVLALFLKEWKITGRGFESA